MPRILEPNPAFRAYIQMGNPSADVLSSDAFLAVKGSDPHYISQRTYVLNNESTALVPLPSQSPLELDLANSVAESKEEMPATTLPRQSFVRVFNVNKFFPQSCAVATITPQQYIALQQLGLTRANDDSLTAKLIGTLGQYRLRILRGQEQWGMQTGLMLIKESICQCAFARLQLLQIIEQAHGCSPEALRASVDNYLAAIKTEFEKVRAVVVPGAKITDTRSYAAFKKEVNRAIDIQIAKKPRYAQLLELNRFYMLGLAKDQVRAMQFAEQINALPKLKSESTFGYDLTRNLVANFVKERANHIIRKIRAANDVVTLAGGEVAFFRGYFNRVLAEAELQNSTYIYDQNLRILPEHQGIYQPESGYVTVTSSGLLGTGQTHLRDFLFGVTYALTAPSGEKGYQPYANAIKLTKGDEAFNSIFNRNHFTWMRKFWPHRKATTINSYYMMRNFTHEANPRWFKTIMQDISNMVKTVWKWLKFTALAIGRNAYHLGESFMQDFKWAEPEIIIQKPETKSTQVLRRHETEADLIISDSVSIGAAEIEQPIKPTSDAALLAMPPYRLTPFSPNDALSKLIGGGEIFYDFLAKYYESSPAIAVYASIVYVMSAVAVINPALLTKLSSSLKFIATWSETTAEAISKSEISRVVSAAFSNFQEVLLTLEGVADGADSSIGDAIRYLKNHLPQAVVGAAAMVGSGYGLVNANIPYLSAHLAADLGNVPLLEQTFLAAKLGVVGYEAFESSPGESSVVARTVTVVMQIAIWPLRMLLLPFNALAKLIFQSTKQENSTWHYVFSPLTDAIYFLAVASLHLADVVLRIFNLIGRAIKTFFKTFSEAVLNAMATLANRPLALCLGLIVATSCFLLLPAMGPLGIFAAFVAAAVIGGALTIALKKTTKINLTFIAPTTAIIIFKHRMYGTVDRFLTRPIKEVYQGLRNAIARVITRQKVSLFLARPMKHAIKSTGDEPTVGGFESFRRMSLTALGPSQITSVVAMLRAEAAAEKKEEDEDNAVILNAESQIEAAIGSKELLSARQYVDFGLSTTGVRRAEATNLFAALGEGGEGGGGVAVGDHQIMTRRLFGPAAST